MKTVFRCLAATAAFGLVAFAFGYFDTELTDERRWSGCGLIVVGIALAWPALVRLADDWPRLKPQHDVDLAFVQVGFSVAILVVACFMGGRFGAALAPLIEPTPKLIL